MQLYSGWGNWMYNSIVAVFVRVLILILLMRSVPHSKESFELVDMT